MESDAEDLRIRFRASLEMLQFHEMCLIPRIGFVPWIKNATTNKSLDKLLLPKEIMPGILLRVLLTPVFVLTSHFFCFIFL